MNLSKIKSLLLISALYVACILICIAVYPLLIFPGNLMQALMLKLMLLDVIGTIFIFIMSCIFKNPSIYGPYWSIAPMALAISFLLLAENINVFSIILVVLICIWGVSFTINWAIRFKGLQHQDWRHEAIKAKYPKLFPVISFFGIHLLPTIIIVIAMVPVFNFIGSIGVGDYQPSIMIIVAVIVCVIAIIIETVADIQMTIFKKDPSNKGYVMNYGLWKNSRHPNYFGELLFWFSMYLVHFSAQTANPWLVFCPLTVFMFFQLVGIPMMEKRQLETKPAYKEYKELTNPLLPIFPPKPKDK